MRVNADFSQRVLLHADEIAWQPSPMPGVHRRMLDRIGDEVARATSIVRYAPGSNFSPHTHEGGEEFLVLEGVFQDEHGDYPAGSYIRNPPTSSHKPGSADGCVIFVKLWQFAPGDRTQVKIDCNKMARIADACRPGVSVTPLFQDSVETVQLETWLPGLEVMLHVPDGVEVLVLEGAFTEGGDVLRKHSWLRLPTGSCLRATAGSQGATVWIKTGHLRSIAADNGERH